jgi:hypothetical protein
MMWERYYRNITPSQHAIPWNSPVLMLLAEEYKTLNGTWRYQVWHAGQIRNAGE